MSKTEQTCDTAPAARCDVARAELAETPHHTHSWLALTSAKTKGGERLRSAHKADGHLLAARPFTHVREYEDGPHRLGGAFPFCGADLAWGDLVVLVAPGADPVALSAELLELSGLLLERGPELLEQMRLTTRPDPSVKALDGWRSERYRRIITREAEDAARMGAQWLSDGHEPAPDPTPVQWPPAWWDEDPAGECATSSGEVGHV